MKVLVGCERSGIIRDSFIKAGHDAASCDLVASASDLGDHYIEDIIQLIIRKGVGYFDLIILHPDCTALTVAGNHVYAEGKPKYEMRLNAILWTELLWSVAIYHCEKVVLENPQGVLGTQSGIGKPHYIQPYDFGEDASKKTGLWLYNLSPLIPTKRFNGRWVEWKGKKWNAGVTKLTPVKIN